MPNFKKKPVVIEAWRWDGKIQTLKLLQSLGMETMHYSSSTRNDGIDNMALKTLEGTSYDVDIGDWIIKGVKGEFYPIKPDIFQLTYDAVEEPCQKK